MSAALAPSLLVASLLRPLVRVCLKRGVRIQELEEAARKAFVEEAKVAIEEAHGDVSVSKISVTTGIHRTEVARLLTGEEKPKTRHDVLNRVIGLWCGKRSFRSADGAPRPLTFAGTASEFAKLVASISKEVTHYPILFELERIGAIEYEDKRVRLKVREFTPSGDVAQGLAVLSEDVEDLALAVEGNLGDNYDDPDLHLRTAFDNIVPEKLAEARRFILERGAVFQDEMRAFLGGLDRDITPDLPAGPKRAKIVVGVFSRGNLLAETKELKPKKRGRKPCRLD